jgi:methionyl-tRNA formyltransferase
MTVMSGDAPYVISVPASLVFIGSSKLSLECLKLIDSSDVCRLAGVITAPEIFQISYQSDGVRNYQHADISSFCIERSIPIVEIRDGMHDEGLFETVAEWRPTAFVVAGWYHMVPEKWRNLAPAYGLHASLLPDYSGGAPLVWALINDESETGISLYLMDDGADTGPLIGQRQIQISSRETIASLYKKVEKECVELLNHHLNDICLRTLELTPQVEHLRRRFPQRSPEDGLIDWRNGVKDIDCFVRAQTKPYPGAFSFLRGHKFTIWSAKPYESDGNLDAIEHPVGKILIIGHRVIVACGRGALEVVDAEFLGHSSSELATTKMVADTQMIFDKDPR